MDITPEQARSELARRELERRSSSVDPIEKRTSFLKSQNPLLKTIGGAFEMAEGVTADIGLALQAGKPQDIVPSIKKTISGERPAQIGDIYRRSQIPILSSEPVASTLGFLETGIKGAPTEILGTGIGKAIGKAFVASKIPELMGKFGKPVVAKALSIASRVPEEDVAKALDNPQYLSRNFLDKEGKEVKQIYTNIVKPTIEDTNNIVDTKKLIPDLKDIKLNIEGRTELTRQATTMRPSEREKITRWLDDIKTGRMTLNRLDAMIGEMDEGLGKVYSAIEKGKAEPVTRTFEALALQMRKSLKNLRDNEFESIAPHFNRYENYKNAEDVYKSFERVFPYIYNLASAEALIHFSGLQGLLGSAGLAGGALTSPKLQSLGIQGVSKLGSAISKSPTLAEESLLKTKQ